MLDHSQPDHSQPDHSQPDRHRGLRLVRSTLGVAAPYVAQAMATHPAHDLLIELTSPDTGQTTSFEPFAVLGRLHGHVPAAAVHGMAVVESGIVSLVWRNGTSVRAICRSGDPWATPVYSLHGNDEPMVDALRRAFGLATPRAMFGPAWYWLMVWIHDLATLCGASVIGVHEAARWHPGLEPDEIDDTDDPAEVVERCLDRLYEHARLTGWDGVRSGAENGWLDLGRCSPSMASWFDNSSFGRALATQLGSASLEVDRLATTDDRITAAARAMFRLMIDGLASVRAMDCHR